MSTPDLDELRRYNNASCKHENTVVRGVAVGVGGGRIGCHMEDREFCADCGAPLGIPMSKAMKDLLAKMETMP